VSESSNSTCNEEAECRLSEEKIESDSGNVSDDSVGFQKSDHSYSTVAEDDTIPSCSTMLSQDVSIIIVLFTASTPICEVDGWP
jgi:hypothetical protein